jgi:hypothetical protein
VSRLAPLEPQALAYDKPLCASLDGFTLHAATRAGALDAAGREALLRYVLRPPVVQERVEQRADGLVRITLKKAYNDGTIAVDMEVPSGPLLSEHLVDIGTRAGAGVEAAGRVGGWPLWGRSPAWRFEVAVPAESVSGGTDGEPGSREFVGEGVHLLPFEDHPIDSGEGLSGLLDVSQSFLDRVQCGRNADHARRPLLANRSHAPPGRPVAPFRPASRRARRCVFARGCPLHGSWGTNGLRCLATL